MCQLAAAAIARMGLDRHWLFRVGVTPFGTLACGVLQRLADRDGAGRHHDFRLSRI